MSQSEGVYLHVVKNAAYTASTGGHLCNCVGPQNGDPCCPCKMRNIKIVDGHWIETIDHGPVPPCKLPSGEGQ